MTIRAEFIAEIKQFLASQGMAASRFGKDAMNDGSFLPRLIDGQCPDTRTIDKVRSFMRGKKTKRKPVA